DRRRLRERSYGAHGPAGVECPDDARDKRDVLGDKPVGIAGAVPVLVARPDDSTDVAEDPADLREEPFTFRGVRFHDRPLLVRQLPRLVDDLARNLDLADVVE